MKKNFTLLIAAAVMLLAMVVQPMKAVGQTRTGITWTASQQGYSNQQAITSVEFDDNVSAIFDKGTNSNAPKYYTSGNAIRCYGGNYFTISTSSGNLTNITITFGSSDGSNAITTDGGTYENGTWTGSATSVKFTIGGTTGNRRIAGFNITYSTGGTQTVATPTFSPAAGAYTSAQNVTISTTTENATIYYTLDGTDPTTSSTEYTGAISVSSNTTIKAMATATGYDNSSIATANYYILNHAGTEADPYSVADARAAIDANTGVTGVYATGKVSAIPTAYNSTYSNITFNMVDESGDEVFLQAYRCGGDEAANVMVGDVAVVYGNLTKYNTTYEFAQGCEVVSLTHTATTHSLTYSVTPQDGGSVTVGTYSASPATVTEGAEVEITATPNTGYTFESWTVIGDGSSVADATAASTTFTMGTEDATLTANFNEVNTYTVTYHANVTGTTDIQNSYSEGEDVTIANNTFSNPGYAFTKWNTNENGTGTDYMPGDVIQSIAANYDLWAQWEESSQATATLNIQSYAEAHSWVNATKYETATVDVVTFTATGGSNTGKYYTSGYEWRYYQGESATITISVSDGYHLKSITPTYNVNNGGVLLNGSTTIQSGSIVEVSGTSVTFSVGNSGSATNGQVKFTNIDVIYESDGGTPAPSIVVDNEPELAYDVTNGTFTFSLNNPVDGGQFSVNTENKWITGVEDPEILPTGSYQVAFTTSTNTAAAERQGVITITYDYPDNTTPSGNATVIKDVTVTQAGNPNIVNNISDINEVGANYHVRGTVVATNARGFIIGDGTGYVYTYLNAAPTQSVGDIVSISGTTGQYGHIIQFTNSATITEATESGYDGGPEYTVITEVPDYSEGYHISNYFQFEGTLTKTANGNYNNYNVEVGESTIRMSYPTDDQITELEALLNKTVRVHGFFAGISGNGDSAVFTTMMESIEEITPTTPAITIDPTMASLPFEGGSATFTMTCNNLSANPDLDVLYFDATGENTADYDWLDTYIDDNNVITEAAANDGTARTGYFKVYDSTDDVYSDLVTVNQAAAPSVAELPFAFDGGRADIATTDGLSQENLGTDYNSSPKLKFEKGNKDNDGLYSTLVLQFNERPGTLTFDIKGNSFSGSTFKVQTSEDGTVYTDLETYTELGNKQSETFDNLGENVRYIRWIYTQKVEGNVALGNIALTEYVEPVVTPSITVIPNEINATAEGGDGSLEITYENIPDLITFDLAFCDATGGEISVDPDWIDAEIQEENDNYSVYYVIGANNGEARTAYFKVYTYTGSELDEVSAIVTVNQEAGSTPPTPTPGQWVLTNLSDLTASDIFVIVGNNGDTYAMSNDKGISSAPAAVAVTVANDALSEEPAANIQWNISITNDGYVFYPNGDNENWLYCNNDNNGLRVGTGGAKHFTLSDNGYLTTTETADQRYIGIYNSQDWRSYKNTTGNIANQTFAFYKKVNSTDPSITLPQYTFDVNSDGGDNVIPVTTQNLAADPQLAVVFYDATGATETPYDWITATINAQGNIDGHIEANDGDARSAYFKVKGLDTNDNWVYSNLVTINQAAYTLSITFETTTLDIEAGGEQDRIISFEYEGLGEDPTFEVRQYDAAGQTQTTYDWLTTTITQGHKVNVTVEANTGDARSAYFKVYGYNSAVNTESNLVTINQEAGTTPPVSGSWVLTPLAELVAGDVFVIVGNDTYALPHNGGSQNAPSLVSVTIEGTTLTGDISEDIQWNLSVNASGYTFHPNGNADTWLFCNTNSASGNNNNMRVGTGDRKVFELDSDNYLVTNDTYTDRYLSIYGTQDWRGYTNTNSAATIKFYKQVLDPSAPSITVNPALVEATKEETDGTLALAYANLDITEASNFDIQFYDGNGDELTESPDWIAVDVEDASSGAGYVVSYLIEENTGAARNAYFKVYALDSNTDLVYSNLVTVNQAAYVSDFATLPFEFDGGRADVETTSGMTQSGLDTDYAASPKLKFKNTGTYVVLRFNAAPVSLSYDIKGNSFSEGTFDVEYSADGETYESLATYTELGATQSITHVDLNNTTRYIRWIYTNKVNGNVALGNIHATENYDTYGDVTFDGLTIGSESLIVHDGSVVTVNGTLTSNNPDMLVIEDGGQFIYDGTNDFYATQQKDITSWNSNAKGVSGWYLIASPAETMQTGPIAVGNYDLFAYDEPQAYWMSSTGTMAPFDEIVRGQGYLYANENDETLNFAGKMKATNSEITVQLSYTSTQNDAVRGFNLVGNPFTRELGLGDMKIGDTEITNYYISEGGEELVPQTISSNPIKPGRGFMIQTDTEGDLVFNPSSKGNTSTHGYISISAGGDNAFINIANGNTLRKMSIANTTKVYVMNGDKDYAAARVEELAGTMPVNFKAVEAGIYTITVEAKDVETHTMYLVDNFTGDVIDLMLESSYTFNATETDSEARFTLVFDFNSLDEIFENSVFAYQSGSDIYVNGNGELQVFDLMGRMVMNTKVNGVQSVAMPQGVYIFRMNDNIQKIVVR